MSVENVATTLSQNSSQIIFKTPASASCNEIISISDLGQLQQLPTFLSSTRQLSKSQADLHVFSVKFVYSCK